MRLTSASRTQLTKVEVVLNQRDHTSQKKPLLTISQFVWLHTNRTQHNIQPFFLGEGLPSLLQLFYINVRHLNRCQLCNTNWSTILLFFFNVLVTELNNTPDTPTKQAIIFLRIFVSNRYSSDAQIRKISLIDIFSHVKIHCYHINDCMTTTTTKS